MSTTVATPLGAVPEQADTPERRRSTAFFLLSPSVAVLLLWMIVPLAMTL